MLGCIDVSTKFEYTTNEGEVLAVQHRDLIFQSQNYFIMFTFEIPLGDDGTIREMFNKTIETVIVPYYAFV